MGGDTAERRSAAEPQTPRLAQWLNRAGALALFVLVAVLDPFNLINSAGDLSERVLLQVASTIYDAPSEHHVRTIAVVPSDIGPAVVDDDAAPIPFIATDTFENNPNEPYAWAAWPPTFGGYAHLLDVVLRAEPSVVFFDILFAGERRPAGRNGMPAEGEPFVERIRTIVGSQDAPTLIFADHPQVRPDRAPRVTLQPVTRILALTDVRRAAISRFDTSELRYEMVVTDLEAPRASHSVTVQRPALVMLKSLCERLPEETWPKGCRDLQAGRFAASPPRLVPLATAIVPADYPVGLPRMPGIETLFPKALCPQRDALRWQRTDELAYWTLPLNALWHAAWCEPMPLQPVPVPMMGSVSQAVLGLNSQLAPAPEDAVGRAVLIGVALPGINDRWDGPVNGVLPGVQRHAVALENLLTLGADYLREPPMLFAGLDINEAVELGLIFIAATTGLGLVARPEARRFLPHDKTITGVVLAAFVPLPLLGAEGALLGFVPLWLVLLAVLFILPARIDMYTRLAAWLQDRAGPVRAFLPYVGPVAAFAVAASLVAVTWALHEATGAPWGPVLVGLTALHYWLAVRVFGRARGPLDRDHPATLHMSAHDSIERGDWRIVVSGGLQVFLLACMALAVVGLGLLVAPINWIALLFATGLLLSLTELPRRTIGEINRAIRSSGGRP